MIIFQKNKIIFITVLLLLCIQPSAAQFRFGLSGGLTVSSHTGKDFSATDLPKFGMTFGFFYEREINEIVSIVIEPSFEQKGTEYTYYPKSNTTVTVDDKLNYTTIPIMLKANLGNKINYYITGGLALSYLNKYSSNVHAYFNEFEIDASPFLPYTYNNMDASISVGAGIMWREIFFDLRYVLGIRSIYNGDNVPDIRNHMVSLKLAFSLYRKRNIPCHKR